MKKCFLYFNVLFTVLLLASCGNKNEQSVKLITTTPAIGEDLAMNKQAADSPKPKVFSGFIYDIGPRFGAIKKEVVQNAKSIEDFIHREDISKMEHINSVTIHIMEGIIMSPASEKGTNATFTEAQLKLLRSLDYSTSLMLMVEFQEFSKFANSLENNYTSPYLTIVPEKQASYMFSEDTLKDYLRVNTEEVRANIDPEKLQAAKLYFTVTKSGAVENVRLDRTSFYPKVDEKMISLMQNLPGAWSPAENIKGERVAQELVVSFGLIGC